MSGSVHVTNGGTAGEMSTAGLELPYPRLSQAKFRDTPLRGRSNVMFVKRLYAKNLHCDLFIVFGKHDGISGNINHLW